MEMTIYLRKTFVLLCLKMIVLLCGVVLINSVLYHTLAFFSTEQSTPHIKWLKERQDALEDESQIKLFLFTYMRGGSSIASELFNCDPSATMWYEPGDAFFSAHYGLAYENLPQDDLYFKNMSRRRLSMDEQEAMVDFYTNIFTCKCEDLPPETMAHHFLKESTAMDGYFNCITEKRTKNINNEACKNYINSICSSKMVEVSLRAKCHMIIAAMRTILDRYRYITKEWRLLELLQDLLHDKGIIVPYNDKLIHFVRHGLCVEQMRLDNAKCIDIAKTKCKNDKLIVVKVNRMKVEDLEPIIRMHPSIQVVYYTRDPRATALSRHRIGFLTFDKHNRSTVREAEYLCHKMREDIRQITILAETYPGVFTHLTYESLVMDPVGFAKKVYGIFNKTYPRGWRAFITKQMHNKRARSPFEMAVQNVKKAAFGWRPEIPKHELNSINRFCADVITALGYEL